MFILVIASTGVAGIPGLSAAGSCADLLPYTSALDAEYLWSGRLFSKDMIPMDPAGHPTPALITKACRNLADFPIMIANAGASVSPLVPHISINGAPGGRIDIEPGLADPEAIFRYGWETGAELSGISAPLFIGESVVGGTTTALCVLRALGYNGHVSSASPVNPISLKEWVWTRALERSGGCVPFCDPFDALLHFGDPMQPFVAGLAASSGGRVVLAGGTQMLAVAALIKSLAFPLDNITVATTKYVAEDSSAHFMEIADSIGVKTWTAPLDFSSSRFSGLSEYELGFVKEGVGAGGACLYAMNFGVAMERIIAETERLYFLLTNE